MARLVARVGLGVFIAITAVHAEDACQQGIDRVQAAMRAPLQDWNDQFVQNSFQNLLDLYVGCLLWQPPFYPQIKSRLPDSPPGVRVEITGALRTPYADGNTVVFPVEYLQYLGAVGAVVGHDVNQDLGDQGSDFNRPLLTTPFRRSSVFGLISPLDSLTNPAAFTQLKIYLDCPAAQSACQLLVAQATSGLILFALLHELSHLALHHVITAEGVNVDQEIAADRNAYEILKLCSSELFKTFPKLGKTLELAQRTAPLAWLQVENARGNITNVVAQARLQALLESTPDSERAAIGDLIEPEEISDPIAKLHVTATAVPSRLWIDGIPFDPAVVVGKTLLVANTKHVLAAGRPGQVALYRSDRASAAGTIEVLLEFHESSPIKPAAVQSAFNTNDWIAVLEQTSDEWLRPRSPVVAPYHWESLHRLKLDTLIKITDWSGIPPADWQRVLNWEQMAKPLISWY